MIISGQKKRIGIAGFVIVARLLAAAWMPAVPDPERGAPAGSAVAGLTSGMTRQTSSPITSQIPSSTADNEPVSVKAFGALGDGLADDTAAIQQALDTGNGVVSIPDGHYRVDALAGLRPKSNQTLRLDPNATLAVIPNAADFYQLVRLEGVSNVEITGGRILGDRAAHLGTTGEHGMGILVGRDTSGIRIRDIRIEGFWGDGIYIGGDPESTIRNVLVERVVCIGNRRQGLSITHAESVTIFDSVFQNTGGTAPQSGLDIEPNRGCRVENVTVRGCQFLDNAGFGLVINGTAGEAVRTVRIDRNRFSGNGHGVVIESRNTADISLVIPESTARIGDGEFSRCYGLDQVSIPDSVTEIGMAAFRACARLKEISLPNRLATIGKEAFKNCTGLTSVSIPASVSLLGNWAFIGCSRLQSAYFHGSDPAEADYVFYECAPGFTVYHRPGAAGFTSPAWRGYPTATFSPWEMPAGSARSMAGSHQSPFGH